MKHLVGVITALATLFTFSCQQKIENEEKFKGWFKSAKVYNYLGQNSKALDCLDSLQISIRGQYSKRISKEKLLKLSEINSRAWIERGKIYREMGDYEEALKCFRRAIIAYYGNDENFLKLSKLDCWDSIVEAYLEKVKTLKKMGKEKEANKLEETLEMYLNVNYFK